MNAMLQGPDSVPVTDWVDFDVLLDDPYPTYERLRREAPIAWVPELDSILVSTFDACAFIEQRPEIFSSRYQPDTITRALGERPMLRKDDPEHAAERSLINSTLRPKAMEEVWSARYADNTDALLDALEEIGPAEADLNAHFAAPLAAQNLMDLLGLRDVPAETLSRWSRDFIAGAGVDPRDHGDVWERCERSRGEATAAIDEVISRVQRYPDESMTSMMIAGGMPISSVRANVNLAISGGVNEPQHMITSLVTRFDEEPDLRPNPDAGHRDWAAVFEEGVRYYCPIGLLGRFTTMDTVLGGFTIPAGTEVSLSIASANRDDSMFADPDRFIPGRTERRHLGFGSGPHLCAGRWAAQSAVAYVALPRLYRRFPSLRVDTERESRWEGWMFRGLTTLPVSW
ncbi:cytochrome P450 [Microbacterium sp. NPDC058062]|uniref:cytochrome P450 n=1 Tax=Microbacterium sp. NPDC058062 TaxID=3346320 RepID=UPI0036DB296E